MISEKRFIGAVAVVLALGLLPVSGCSQKKPEDKAAEKMMEEVLRKSTGKDAHVNVEKGKVEVEANGVKTEMSETSFWPPEMFKDVPQFPSGKIERVVKSNEEGGKKKFNIYYVGIETDAVKKYADLLKKGGWQTEVTQMDKGGILNAQKGNMAVNFPYSLEDKSGTLLVYDVQN